MSGGEFTTVFDLAARPYQPPWACDHCRGRGRAADRYLLATAKLAACGPGSRTSDIRVARPGHHSRRRLAGASRAPARHRRGRDEICRGPRRSLHPQSLNARFPGKPHCRRRAFRLSPLGNFAGRQRKLRLGPSGYSTPLPAREFMVDRRFRPARKHVVHLRRAAALKIAASGTFPTASAKARPQGIA
jgi:hypothetical protein